MMKLVLFTVVLWLTAITSFSQDCKFVKKEKIDELTGLPVLLQKSVQINKVGALDVRFFYSTNRCRNLLNLVITRGGLSKELNFNNRTPVIFYFSDSSTLQLFPSKDYYSYGSFSVADMGLIGIMASEQTDNVIYDVSNEKINLIATKSIERIRICYSPPNYGAPIKDSSLIIVEYKENRPSKEGKEDIRALSKCILGVSPLDADSCLQAMERLRLKLNPPKSNDEIKLQSIKKGASLTEKPYQSLDELQPGDIVKYKTAYGQSIYGIAVEKIGKNKVKIKSYPSPGTELFVEESIKNIVKVQVME